MAYIRAAVALLLVVAGLAVANPASGDTFSDNVNMIVRANGILDIIGDNDDNRVTLCQNPDDSEEFSLIIIIDTNNFRVETRTGVTKDVRFNMRGGDDVVQINGEAAPPADCDDIYPPPAPDQPVGANGVCITGDHECHHDPEMLFPRDLRVLLGSGSNTLNGYDFGVVDDLTVRGGSGFEVVGLRYVNIWDRADLNVLSGGSTVRISNSYFGRSSIRSSTGLDFLNFDRTDLGNRPIITTGSSDDRVSGHRISAEGRFTINTGGGADRLSLFRRGCHDVCGLGDHEEAPYQLNVIMGAQNDTTEIGFELVQGDRLNGGSGNGDQLLTENVVGINAVGGPTINGYEFIGPLVDDD